MDYCENGDLDDQISLMGCFSEEKARFYLCCVILALQDLHQRDIIFRDLKPENVLLDKEGFGVLAVFGLSKEEVSDPFQGADSFCGSIAYLSPEVALKNSYGKAVDWYLLGVLFYEMLFGTPPYISQDKDNIIESILFSPLKFPKPLSPEAKSLLIGVF
jgi:serine/threonine protein kinase